MPRPVVILLGCLAGACAGYVGSWLRTRGLGEIHGWFALAGFVVGGFATAWFGDRAARLLNFIAPGG